MQLIGGHAQEERQRTPQGVGSALIFDQAGHPTLKTPKKDFYVPNPDDDSGLKNRFEVMGAMLEMLKLKFMSNPILATASLSLMKDYSDFLCGEKVWGLVVKGTGGVPLACPHIGQVLH